MPDSQSPRWARLVKVEEIETDKYFIDVYSCPIEPETLREKYLQEPPVLYAFAIFNRDNQYLLSYALEMREALRDREDGSEETYIGYFLETYCEHQRFSCKNFKDVEPTFELVKSTVIAFVVEYDAVQKMIDYDKEIHAQQHGNFPQN
ncbi:MAG: hypothetical protein HY22_09920 [[Candidatus Thermochlorobacteriaceae] bacterium GBChlB]|nr:MAG: hypothetical protein HY22_09920 [[Candidatus Thermochlorobacteriaceae] bacterium GBChlB]